MDASLLDVVRYAAVLFGAMLLGTNLAFIVKADEIFACETTKFWRIFFVGKSIITAYLAWSVYTSKVSPLAKAGVAMLGIGISLYALVYLYKSRLFLVAKVNREEKVAQRAIEELEETNHGEQTPPT